MFLPMFILCFELAGVKINFYYNTTQEMNLLIMTYITTYNSFSRIKNAISFQAAYAMDAQKWRQIFIP